MSKAMRKPRPSMPQWFWLGQDGCWFCNNRNNCNQCKANRESSKGGIRKNPELARQRDKRQIQRMNDHE